MICFNVLKDDVQNILKQYVGSALWSVVPQPRVDTSNGGMYQVS